MGAHESRLPRLWVSGGALGRRVLRAGSDPLASPAEAGLFHRELAQWLALDLVEIDVGSWLCTRKVDAAAIDALREIVLAVGAVVRVPRAVRLPGPGRLAQASGAPAPSEDDIDDAALALADVVRALKGQGLAAVALDETLADAYDFYAPILNTLGQDDMVPALIDRAGAEAAESAGAARVYSSRTQGASTDHGLILPDGWLSAPIPPRYRELPIYAELDPAAEPETALRVLTALRG